MTTPTERLKSIGWGAELLDTLAQDETVPVGLRTRAAAAAQRYPTTSDLSLLIESNAEALPMSYAQTIEEALNVFDDFRQTKGGSEGTRRLMRYTLRHFPATNEALERASYFLGFPLTAWLASEG